VKIRQHSGFLRKNPPLEGGLSEKTGKNNSSMRVYGLVRSLRLSSFVLTARSRTHNIVIESLALSGA
jgi:hypothetical protein